MGRACAFLRIGDCVALHGKDNDVDLRSISVWVGKGEKDRTTLMSQVWIPDLRKHWLKVYQQRYALPCVEPNIRDAQYPKFLLITAD